VTNVAQILLSVIYQRHVQIQLGINQHQRTNSFDHAIKDPFHLMFLMGPSPWCRITVLRWLRKPFSFKISCSKK